jgi:hypothetical protein
MGLGMQIPNKDDLRNGYYDILRLLDGKITNDQNEKISKYVMDISLKIPFPKKKELCNCGHYDGIHLPITNEPSCEEFSEDNGEWEINEDTYNHTKNEMNEDDDHGRPEFERANIHARTGVWL